MKEIITFIIISFSLTALCQEREATILFNDNTSIKGFGEIKKEKIYFRVSLDEKVSEWSYDMAKGLIFSGYGFSETYLYVNPGKYSKKEVLMEVVEEGNVCLYKKNVETIRVAGINEPLGFSQLYDDFNSTYYVQRKNEEYATDISFSFKSRSVRYFADCKILVEKINRREFKVGDMPEIVFYYNDYCDSEN